jgi:uncharacterized membrane protein
VTKRRFYKRFFEQFTLCCIVQGNPIFHTSVIEGVERNGFVPIVKQNKLFYRDQNRKELTVSEAK